MKTPAPATAATNETQLDLEALQGAGYSTHEMQDVQALRNFQLSLGLDHTKFCDGSSVDPTQWSRVLRGKYPGRRDKVIIELKRHAKHLEQRHGINSARASSQLNGREFIRFNEYDAVKTAINTVLACADRDGENKLVIYCAPSGGGKTALGRELLTSEGYNATMITARPTWSTAYFPALMAIARQFKVHDGLHSAAQAETAILEEMQKSKGILIVNEVELLCRQVRHLFRAIMNETPWCVLLLVTPEGYRHLANKPSSDSAQLLRRCESIITASTITAPQVHRFLEQHWQLTPELRHAAIEIAKEANEFGAFDFIVRVIELLVEELHGTGEVPTKEHIASKLIAARRAMPLVKSTRAAA